MAIFKWPASRVSADETPRILSARFGDGYEQRRPDGINHIVQSWSLAFNCKRVADAQAIRAFLRAHRGVDLFQWAPPDSKEVVLVICRQWSGDAEPGDVRTVSATFERVYG